MTEPAALSNTPLCATTLPLLAIVPPAFEIDPAPLPALIVRVPVPACVIVPWSLTKVVGASVKSMLLVCSVPPAELSNVPLTSMPITAAPYCVIAPPWFTRLAAFSASWFASISPPLLSSVASVAIARFGATIAPPRFVIDPVWIVAFEPAPS
ncbi:hypothetical protein LMG28688_07188 [Paraburkholderia caffeinitolerans]|uniref:Uncharacterized protein n=1 Tax=Paraburkholderia caffeinitolerans TaxID=1723730 RepID=A0A6J5H785_9BURK|nr:hypothetical protein LMG28688_07188 [Paraburkholderia caffeinitolerans]